MTDMAQQRSTTATIVITLCALLLLLVFVGLGVWQIQRLFWKLDLIARVDQRVQAAAVDAPHPAQWQQISAANDEYRHVQLHGTYLTDLRVQVQATTALGPGFWLITPLQRDDGSIVLINRGFIHANAANLTPDAIAPVTVNGLLRISEPGGGFLHSNDPANQRWYSRDVAAIAAFRHLTNVAPYFVDAEAIPNTVQPSGMDNNHPVPGLTVIRFHNNHLVYSVTWFALAAMLGWAVYFMWLKATLIKSRAPRIH